MQQATKKVDSISANNLLLILLLVSLIVIGATGLVAKSLIVGIIRDTKVLSATNKAKSTLDKNLQSAPKLVSEFEGLEQRMRDTLADALPNDNDFPSLIVALENIASDSNFILKSVAPGQVMVSQSANSGTVSTTSADSGTGSIEPPRPKPYVYTVAFDGSYISLLKFMNDLELYTRPMRVTSLKLSGTGNALSGTVDVQTFYQDKAALPYAKEIIK